MKAKSPALDRPNPDGLPSDRAVVALLLAVFFVWLGRMELLGPDEARHIEIARSMLARGSFLVPQLDGEPYYDKPAAYYWLVAASLRLFGNTEFAARLPTALAALLTVCMTARFAARTYGARAARCAALVMATAPVFVALGRYGLLDMTLTAALTCAFTSLGLWWYERRPTMPKIFYVGIAAAALIKGPVAYVQAATSMICLLALSARDRSRSPRRTLRALSPVRGLLISTAIAAPWYLAAAAVDPDYIATFLFSHNLERFAGSGPGVGHIEPWWYYAAALPLMLMPWTPWVAAGLFRLRSGKTDADADLFCVLWAASVASVYLAAGSRLATYLLPAVVPLLCLAAARVESSLRLSGTALVDAGRAARRWAIAVSAFVSACAAVACAYVAVEQTAAVGRLWTAVPAILAFPLTANLPPDRAPRRWLGATALAALALTTAAYGVAGDVVGNFKDMRTLASIIDKQLPPPTRVLTFRVPAHAATFYSGRLMRVIDEPELALDLLAEEAPTAIVIRRRHVPYLGNALPTGITERWSSLGGMVLLSNVGASPVSSDESGDSDAPA